MRTYTQFLTLIFLVICLIVSSFCDSLDTKSESGLLVISGNVQGHISPTEVGVTGNYGGLPRKATYISKLRNKGNDPIILDAGDLFFPEVKLSEIDLQKSILKAETVVKGYNLIGCDAFNIGTKDFAGGVELIFNLRDNYANFPFISANVVYKNSSTLLFEPYVIVVRNGFKFGVIGVTTELPNHIQELDLLDPITALKNILPKIEKKSDYQIVLFNGTKEEAKTAQESLQAVDFIFLSGNTQAHSKTVQQPISGPKLYNLGRHGISFAVLQLNIESADSALVDISSLKVREKFLIETLELMGDGKSSKNLEAVYKGNTIMLNKLYFTRNEMKSVQQQLSNLFNTCEIDIVHMDFRFKDNPILLQMVNETNLICDRISASSRHE